MNEYAELFDISGEILAGRHGTDGTGQDVVEEQGGHREFRQPPAHGGLDNTVHTAPDEHGAGFDIERPNSRTKQHHPQNEPGSALSDYLLGITGDVVGRGSKIRENDSGSPPERDEGQHHRSGDED